MLVVETHAWGVPAWSPDGSKFAFWKITDEAERLGRCPGFCTEYDLWIADGDGANAHLLTANGATPAWSRDGKWIYYWSHGRQPSANGGTAHVSTDLYRILPDGTGKTLLFQGEPNRSSLMPPGLLPDGRLVIIRTAWEPGREISGKRTVEFFDPETQRITGAVPGLEQAQGWVDDFISSPDGRQMAVVFGEKLWIGPASGGTFRPVAEMYPSFESPPMQMSWSADGRFLTYVDIHMDAVWVVGADGSSPKKITDLGQFPHGTAADGRAFVGYPVISPDGKLAYFGVTVLADGYRLSTYVADVATGLVRLLSGKGYPLSLSPDGSTVLLASWDTSPGKLLMQRPLLALAIAP